MKKLSILLILFSLFISTQALADKMIIGKWVLNDKYVGRTIEIYEENGQIYIFRKFHNDGSRGTYKLIKATNNSGETIYKLPNSYMEDHYLITRNNRLQIKDKLGVIDVAQPVK
jgi:hypothetical protein